MQFVEVLAALVVWSAFHGLCYLLIGRHTFESTYDIWTGFGSFGLALFAVIMLHRSRQWHVGQISLFLLGALSLSVAHLLLHPALIGECIWRMIDAQ
jgi:multidrug transporter EmrE-like cation transporter